MCQENEKITLKSFKFMDKESAEIFRDVFPEVTLEKAGFDYYGKTEVPVNRFKEKFMYLDGFKHGPNLVCRKNSYFH